MLDAASSRSQDVRSLFAGHLRDAAAYGQTLAALRAALGDEAVLAAARERGR